VTEARQLASQMVREAEAEAERMRHHGTELMESAKAERERILGGLAASRDATVAELAGTREHMQTVIQQLDVAGATAQGGQTGLQLDEIAAEAEAQDDPDDGDILEQVEGFEIMLPEFMAREEPDQEPVVRPDQAEPQA